MTHKELIERAQAKGLRVLQLKDHYWIARANWRPVSILVRPDGSALHRGEHLTIDDVAKLLKLAP